MAANGYLQTVFADGIRHANFFNGRLLSAEDLGQEADAEHRHLALLGAAVGAGIAGGLWVTAAQSTLTVAPGLAINRDGVGLRLAATASFDISPTAPVAPAPDVIFTACEPAEAPASPTAIGAYVLVMCPAATFEGSVPIKPLTPSATRPLGCGRKWRLEGVAFQLVKLELPARVAADTSRRRNRIGHVLLGTERLLGPDGVDLLDTQPGLDTLPGIHPHQVPLAVLYWTGRAIEFVDNWAVRRRITRPAGVMSWTPAPAEAAAPASPPPAPPAPLTPWGGYTSDWLRAQGEARFLQFQDHVASLGQNAVLSDLESILRYVPPAGFLPVTPEYVVALQGRLAAGARGETGYPTREITREIATVLLEQSFLYEAVDLLEETPVTLVIAENVRQAGPTHQAWLFFVKRSLFAEVFAFLYFQHFFQAR